MTSSTTVISESLPAVDVEALHAACDRLVATAPDPAAARSILLRMWALGAAVADDLLVDLRGVAQRHAARTGTEASAAELLDVLGHHQHAAAMLAATTRGLAEHDASRDARTRAGAATAAARAAVRLHHTSGHRRLAA